jgi:hypothetical protein
VPRYFLHLFDGVDSIDEEGTELADDAAAFALALRSARELAADEVKRGCLDLDHRIEAFDENSRLVASISFGEAAGLRLKT